MAKKQIIRLLKIIAENDLKHNEVVDVTMLNSLIERRMGYVKWSSREIAGSMAKVADVFQPIERDRRLGLKTYINLRGYDLDECSE